MPAGCPGGPSRHRPRNPAAEIPGPRRGDLAQAAQEASWPPSAGSLSRARTRRRAALRHHLYASGRLVVQSPSSTELDVRGFRWAGVFKPVARIDDWFSLAEPPTHDDWVPQAVPDKAHQTGSAGRAVPPYPRGSNRYLSPHEPTTARLRGRPHRPLMLVICSRTSSSGLTVRLRLPGLCLPAPRSTRVAQEPAEAAARGPATALRACHPAYRYLQSAPGRHAGAHRQRGGHIHLPARAPGWTRVTLDVQLAEGSPAAPAVDVSAHVRFRRQQHREGRRGHPDPRLVEQTGHTCTSPIKLRPGVIRQFAIEARSDLAIDVSTRLGDR